MKIVLFIWVALIFDIRDLNTGHFKVRNFIVIFDYKLKLMFLYFKVNEHLKDIMEQEQKLERPSCSGNSEVKGTYMFLRGESALMSFVFTGAVWGNVHGCAHRSFLVVLTVLLGALLWLPGKQKCRMEAGWWWNREDCQWLELTSHTLLAEIMVLPCLVELRKQEKQFPMYQPYNDL